MVRVHTCGECQECAVRCEAQHHSHMSLQLRPHIFHHSRVHGYVPCGCVRLTGACAPPRVTLHHEAGSVTVESALVLDHDGATTFAKSQRSQQVGIWVV